MNRWIVTLVVIVASSCSKHPPAAHTDFLAGPPAPLLPPEPPEGRRVVHLASATFDTSCLDQMGGTSVATDLSDDDIRKIESLILTTDPLPIIEIGRLPAFAGRPDRRPPDFELTATTGAECGPFSGHGNVYRLNRVDGEWTLTPGGSWVS